MAPTTPDKDRQFAFILSGDELAMLKELAEAEHRSAANWLRVAIVEAHEKKFGAKKKPKR